MLSKRLKILLFVLMCITLTLGVIGIVTSSYTIMFIGVFFGVIMGTISLVKYRQIVNKIREYLKNEILENE